MSYVGRYYRSGGRGRSFDVWGHGLRLSLGTERTAACFRRRLSDVVVYALVTAESPLEAVDVFLREDDANEALEDAISDEPSWVNLLSVVPIQLREDGWSPN
jgi:hypothetical protein